MSKQCCNSRFRVKFANLKVLLPLNDPVIAPIDRTINKSDIEEIVVSKRSLKSRSVGPSTDPHNPWIYINAKYSNIMYQHHY